VPALRLSSIKKSTMPRSTSNAANATLFEALMAEQRAYL
jgi:hypothetical protein